jgi:hypothetical protein
MLTPFPLIYFRLDKLDGANMGVNASSLYWFASVSSSLVSITYVNLKKIETDLSPVLRYTG